MCISCPITQVNILLSLSHAFPTRRLALQVSSFVRALRWCIMPTTSLAPAASLKASTWRWMVCLPCAPSVPKRMSFTTAWATPPKASCEKTFADTKPPSAATTCTYTISKEKQSPTSRDAPFLRLTASVRLPKQKTKVETPFMASPPKTR